jgi:hypothetical protein
MLVGSWLVFRIQEILKSDVGTIHKFLLLSLNRYEISNHYQRLSFFETPA